MSITAIARYFTGYPNIVAIVTDNTLSEITTAGYFTSDPIKSQVELLNNGEWQWQDTDQVLISYAPDFLVNWFKYNASTGAFVANPASGGLSNTLPSGDIFVGNVSNIATAVAMSGDATLSNTGVLTIANNAVNSAKLSPNVFKSVTVSLTPTQIKALYDTPIQLVAAPGALSMIVIDSINYDFTYFTTQYTAGGSLAAQYGNAVHGAGPAASTSIAAATLNALVANTELSQSGVTLNVAKSSVNNVAVYLSNATANFASGDSPITLTVRYHVVTLT